MADKNKALIKFIMQCDAIKNSSLYFILAKAEDNSTKLVPLTEDVAIRKPYIDGSEKRRYSLTLITWVSMSENPIVNAEGFDNENVSDMASVQALIDWVDLQNENQNFPDFGLDCIVEKISTTTGNPNIDRIQTTESVTLAQYSFTIQIEYIDNSKVLWK